jgi:cytochrome c oxidase subunit 2
MPLVKRSTLLRCLTGSSLVLLSACSGEYPQTTFDPVSEFGRVLNSLFAITFWWTMGILVLVELLIVVAIFRFRERPNQPPPPQIHGNVKLEFLWTLIPAVIVLFISIPTIQVVFATQKAPPDDALVVEVIGHQWWWEFRYPEYGVTTANELVLPVGRNIDLKMHSADVIHSFWVPRVGGKRDVNPQPRAAPDERGPRSNHLNFNIEQPGFYNGQCAEYCGESHAIMRMAINAQPPAEFEQWVTSMGGRRQGAVPPETTTGAATVEAGAGRPPVQTEAQERAAAVSAADSLARARAAQDTTRTPLQGPATPAGPQSDEQRGQQIFTSRACIACHTIQGTSARGVLGPNLTRFGARRYVGAGAKLNTLDNVIAWINHPQALKPGALMPGAKSSGAGMPPTGLSDEEVRLVATYLLSLK